MEVDKKRLYHSLMVAKKMKEIAYERYPESEEFVQDMFVLGLVHDMGYEFVDSQLDHEREGGLILKRQNYQYWKEVYWHGNPNSEYQSEALDILNIADIQTNHDGKYVTVEERLEGIRSRYGSETSQYKNAMLLAKKIGLI